MKKYFLIIAICFLVGCQSNNFDINERADEILALVKEDGFDNMEVTSATDDEVIIKDDKCTVTASFNDKKLVKIISEKSDKSDEEAYSCVFRTLARDKDLLGDNKEKYEQYMEKFREGKDFDFENLKVTNDFINMSIEVIK